MSSSRALFFLAVAPVLWLAGPAHAADVGVTLGAGDGFSVKNNTGAIERLRVDEATGNVSRNGALFVHTTGSATNLFVGPLAGGPATTGTRNAAFGDRALAANTTGQQNAAFGYVALRNNTTGIRNSAFGGYALANNTTANDNSAFGNAALYFNTTGIHNSAFGEEALTNNSTGGYNSAFGRHALRANTTGVSNSAFGYGALRDSTGTNNSAFGSASLRNNTTGYQNSAFGEAALQFNTTGTHNSAFGRRALRSITTGTANAAFGYGALRNTTGNLNVALGHIAGSSQTTGSNNIYIANVGVAGESGQIKIGSIHSDTFIAGIFGNTLSSGSTVFVNGSNELGVAPSSIRFKEAVRDMGEASEKLKQLRPVVFRYRAEEGEPASGVDEYGLIAEEVAAVAPELVVNDADGKPYSVRYHVLPALLLNELQEQQRTNDAQQRTIEALVARVAELEKRSPPDAEVAAR